MSQLLYQHKSILVPMNYIDSWCLRNQLLIKSL